jgi:hypothetical protein
MLSKLLVLTEKSIMQPKLDKNTRLSPQLGSRSTYYYSPFPHVWHRDVTTESHYMLCFQIGYWFGMKLKATHPAPGNFT